MNYKNRVDTVLICCRSAVKKIDRVLIYVVDYLRRRIACIHGCIDTRLGIRHRSLDSHSSEVNVHGSRNMTVPNKIII